MPLNSISSCWRSGTIASPKGLIDELKEVGFNSIELEFRIKKPVFEEIKKNIAAWGMKVSSIHAVCPSPEGRGRGAEAFFLNDKNEDNRKRAVEDVVKTLEHASDLKAKTIVLHAGKADMEQPTDEMRTYFDNGDMDKPHVKDRIQQLITLRKEAGKRCYEQLLKSLITINHEAASNNIMVGLENRYHFDELPGIFEFNHLLNAFHGGNIGYWHDTGHAHAQESLYGISHKELLNNCSGKLIGVHLHDVVGGYKDHQEPGCGEIDFTMIKSFLKLDVVRVMELNNKVSMEKAKKGALFLKETGIFN